MSISSDISLKTIDGKAETLGAFDGKALLIVNVASKCGFTAQYAGLEALHKRFRDRGFEVLGFPCDQFGHQEPGDEAEIAKFCSLTYDVSFPMFAKVEVNGPNAHPLYKALKQEAPGLLGTGDQMELHQVPARSEAQRRQALRADRQAGIARASTSRRCFRSFASRCTRGHAQGVVARVGYENGSGGYSKSVTHVRKA